MEKRSAQVSKAGRNNCAIIWVAVCLDLRRIVQHSKRLSSVRQDVYSSSFFKSWHIWFHDELYPLIFASNAKQVTFSMQCCLGLGEPLTLWKRLCVTTLIYLQWFILAAFWQTEDHVKLLYRTKLT